MRCRPSAIRKRNGTAIAKRNAVRVIGGMDTRPSLVTGIESPQMSASSSRAEALSSESRVARFGRGGAGARGALVVMGEFAGRRVESCSTSAAGPVYPQTIFWHFMIEQNASVIRQDRKSTRLKYSH